jgi:hypothetical protein
MFRLRQATLVWDRVRIILRLINVFCSTFNFHRVDSRPNYDIWVLPFFAGSR